MFSLKRIYQFIITVVCVISFTTKAQTTLNTTQTIPVDETKRDPNSIKLQSGFKYGAGASGSRLTLQVNNNPSYVENGYIDNRLPCSKPNFNNALVGEIEGSFEVSLTGAATYQIPIKTSPGTAGVQPNIAIAYASGSGNGLLGLGWHLSGLSSISRTNKVPYLDGKYGAVNLDLTDVFALDGSRLLLRTGAQGSNGSTYGTETESFATITANGTQGFGPASFTIIDKNGTTTEYGNITISPNSRLNGISDNTPMAWYISKITDIYGNYISYEYKQLLGEVVIDKILYTGTVSFLPYAEINFEYITKTEKSTAYVAGKEFRNTQLLKAITVKNNNELVKKYVLDYEYDHNTLLRSVIEINQDGSELIPTTFCYNVPSAGTTSSYASARRLDFYPTTPAKYNTLKRTIGADLNGDGFSDVIAVQPNNTYDVFTNNYVSTRVGTPTNIDFTNIYSSSISNPVFSNTIIATTTLDKDVDGNQEVYNILNDRGSGNEKKYHIQKISYNSGSIQINTVLSKSLLNTNVINTDFYKYYYDFSDYNGDGVNDEIIIDPENVFINSSLGNKTLALSANSMAKPMDFDGDGIPEIAVFKDLITSLSVEIFKYPASNAINLVLLYSTSISYSDNSITPKPLHKLFSIGDFNADGKVDVLHLNRNKNTLSIKYSDGKVLLPSKTISNFDALTSFIDYNISCPDYNGDGTSDIILTEQFSIAAPQNYVSYYFVGDLLIKGFVTSGKFNFIDQIVKMVYPVSSIWNKDVITGTKTEYKTVKVAVSYEYKFDTNGDGDNDLITFDGTQINNLVDNLLSPRIKYIDNIYTGLKKHITIGYENPQAEFNIHDRYFYNKSTSNYATSNLFTYKPTNYVVTYVQHRSSANNVIPFISQQLITYEYTGALYHKFGKGFLGYEEVVSQNAYYSPTDATNYYKTHNRTKTIFDQNQVLPLSVIQTVDAFKNKIFTKTLSKSVTNFQITATTAGSKFIAPSSITSKDFLNSTSVTTNYTYYLLQHGNLASKTTEYGWSGIANQSNLKSETINYTYQNLGGIFKPLKETYTTIQNAPSPQTPYVRETDYAYDTQDRLTSIINDASIPDLKSTTNFETYNAFGQYLVTHVTGSSYGKPFIRGLMSTYDNKGRFVISTRNSVNQFEFFVYDQQYGSLLQKTDKTGLISKYTYDGLGRLIKSQLPNNTVNTVNYVYEPYNPNNSYNPVYSKTVRNEGEPYKKSYFNSFGLSNLQETEDVNGNVIVTKAIYDQWSGQIIEKTEPHYKLTSLQPNYLVSKYFYDPDYNRLTRKETHLATNSNFPTYTSQNIFTNIAYNNPSIESVTGIDVFNEQFVTTTDHTNNSATKINNAAGQLVTVKNSLEPTGTTSNYQATNYQYYSNGKPKNITLNSTLNANPITHSFTYDAIGQQSQFIDPSAGTINYKFNSIGDLLHQDDATGSFDYNYDDLGRITSKNGSLSGLTSYEYVNTSSGLNQIEKITSPTETLEYEYDALQFNTSFKETINHNTPKVLTTLTNYDKYGNLTKYTYPNNIEVNYKYNPTGFLTAINDANNNPIWQITNQNAIGQITEYKQTNGNSIINNTNAYTLLHNLDYTEHGSIYKLDYNFDPLTGNLLQRDVQNFLSGTHNREKFEFDIKNRLRKGHQHDPLNMDALMAGTINQIDIDEKGNITHKDDAGDFVYSNTTKPFNLTQINNPTSNVSLNTLGVTYNDLRKVSQLTELVNGKEMNFTYGVDKERIKIEYLLGGAKQYTRFYHANYELEEKPNGDVTEWAYINAPTGLTAIYKKQNNGTLQLFTVLNDHLGTPVLLTDNNQNIVDEFSFDAWGRKRNPTNWSYTGITNNIGFHRGYTFHEQIDEFALINMNGRVYDPILGRFIQADNNIQSPDNLQNFNRYTYCLNNPLMYNDPDGQFWHIVIGAAIGGIINTAMHWDKITSSAHPWQTGLIAFGIGAGAGALGAATGAIGFAAAGGAAGGVGGFVAGAVGGMTGYAFSAPLQSSLNSDYLGDPYATPADHLKGMAIAGITGGLVNGSIAAYSGRNFWNGKLPSSNNFNVSSPPITDHTTGKQGYVTVDEGTVEFPNTKNIYDIEIPSVPNNGNVDKGVFIVTKDGVVMPQGAKIPSQFVENANRSGDYGLIENGKFVSKVRIDPATPLGKKGPNVSHYHLNGGKEHLFDSWPFW